jgi:phosphopantothenoylcysteine decarboxylase/phosphopantothenate--cysteine ligase
MLEPAEIADTLVGERPAPEPGRTPLAGARVLLTAGPTREPLDPVRYLGNRSSGRMGFALAEALADLGARVVLVSGPCALATPAGIERVDVVTALQMHAATMERVSSCDLFVGAAAVADFRPAEPASEKIKKGTAELSVRLVRNPDILAEVAALASGPFTVGFAAETERVEEYALGKLSDKRLDMIAANRVGGEQGGFEREENALTVLWPGGRRELPMTTKSRLARELALTIAERYGAST